MHLPKLSLTTVFAMGTFAAQLLAQPAGSPPAAASRPAQIDRNGVLILVRSTLLALQQANETGNYTVLRDLASPAFQQTNTAARLGEIFANQRAQNLDLSGIVVLEPQLTLLPQIEGNGLMHLAGFFPSVPTQINFELVYAPVNGHWRPYGISVQLGSSSPVAPDPAGATPPSQRKTEVSPISSPPQSKADQTKPNARR